MITLLILLISFIIHESSHILVAYLFNCKIDKIRFFFLGVGVYIVGLYSLPKWKQFMVLCAGLMSHIITLFLNISHTWNIVSIASIYLNIFPFAKTDGDRLFSLITDSFTARWLFVCMMVIFEIYFKFIIQ